MEKEGGMFLLLFFVHASAGLSGQKRQRNPRGEETRHAKRMDSAGFSVCFADFPQIGTRKRGNPRTLSSQARNRGIPAEIRFFVSL